MHNLGQYYTEQKIGRLMARLFQSSHPRNVLELGAGKGTLITAVKERWDSIHVVSAEIDSKNYARIRKKFPSGSHFKINALSYDLDQLMGLKPLSIDLAVCNPPYGRVGWSDSIEKILENSDFKTLPKDKEITADLIFLAQNLKYLKSDGELGIILPDGFLSSHKYEKVREILIDEHCISAVIDLPEKIFLGTEAKTHIVILRKGQQRSLEIPIMKADQEGKLINKILIPASSGAYRLDYNYHAWHKSNKTKHGKSLASLGVEIKRGNVTRKDCLEFGIEHFHSTTFKNLGEVVSYKKRNPLGFTLAQAGDILLSRVGKRCLGKVAIVAAGSVVLTDCVYRIRAPQIYRSSIFKSLKSVEGQKWLQAHAHGVCAKVISKKDLLSFKV